MPVLAFLVAAAYVPGIFSAASMPRWWVIAIGLPLVSKLDPWSLTPAVRWIWLSGLVWAFAMLFISRHPLEGSLDFFFLLLMFGVAVAASERDDLGPVMTGFVIGLGLSSILVVVQFFGWSPVPQTASPAGLFFNREILAEVAAPLLVWSVLNRKLGQALICTIPVALCDSRIAVLVTVLCIGYAWLPKNWWARFSVAGLTALASGAGLFMLGAGKIGSAGLRMVLWGTAVLSITPMGHGLGYWRDAHPFPIEEFVHSDALQLLVELGCLGAVFFVIPAIVLWRGQHNIAERAAFIAICLEAVVSFPLHGAAGAFIFAALAGFMARDRAPVHDPGLPRGIAFGQCVRWQETYAAGLDRAGQRVGASLPLRPSHRSDA